MLILNASPFLAPARAVTYIIFLSVFDLFVYLEETELKKSLALLFIATFIFSTISPPTPQVEAQSSAIRLLIDEGHSEWLVSGNTQKLIQVLEDKGYIVDTFIGTITLSVLSTYDIFVIGIAWASFVQSEIQAIEDYVENGGGLWLMGLGWSWVDYHPDSTIYDYPMNQIAQRFGAFYNPDIIFDPTDYTTDPGSAIFHTPFIFSHPATIGVSRIGAAGMCIGSITIQTGTILITGDDDSYGGYPESPYLNPGMHPPMLAAVFHGYGRVIVGSHEGFFHDNHIDDYDNNVLGLKIVDWLAKQDRSIGAHITISHDQLGNMKTENSYYAGFYFKVTFEPSFVGDITAPPYLTDISILITADNPAIFKGDGLTRIVEAPFIDEAIKSKVEGIFISTILSSVTGIIIGVSPAIKELYDLAELVSLLKDLHELEQLDAVLKDPYDSLSFEIKVPSSVCIYFPGNYITFYIFVESSVPLNDKYVHIKANGLYVYPYNKEETVSEQHTVHLYNPNWLRVDARQTRFVPR